MSRSASVYLSSARATDVLAIERQCHYLALSKRLESKLAFRLQVRSFFLWKEKMGMLLDDDLKGVEANYDSYNYNKDGLDDLESKDEIDEAFSASLDKLFLFKERVWSGSVCFRLRKAFIKMVNNPPDLKCLGPSPEVLKPLFRQNEAVLWALYIAYCTNPRNVPQNNNLTKQEKQRKKLLEFDCLWRLLRDFNLCPDLCSQIKLRELLFDVMAENSNSSSSGGGGLDSSPPSPDRSMKSSPGKAAAGSPERAATADSTSPLSFEHFLKLLWRLALDCMVVSELASAPVRLRYLFVRMDTSGGWQKVQGGMNNLRLKL